jgi:hypothetical protein
MKKSMNEALYLYKDKNITTLILGKIEHIVRLLAEKDGRQFDECYPAFISSRAYENLINTDTLLWGESAEFILDDYLRERNLFTHS